MKVREKGFTLIELVVTMTIVAILAAVATPSFRSIIERNRASSAASTLQVSLSLARSEAIRRGSDAAIYVFANTTAGVWSGGWTVFWAKTAPGTPYIAPTADVSNSLLRVEVVPAYENVVTNTTSNLSSIPDYFLFNGEGRLVTMTGAQAYRTVSFQSGDSDRFCVIVGSSGRARIATVGASVPCAKE